jgi:uncharacterized protein (DUF1697 family)
MGSRHVALMRGINVGGKNKLPMKDLVAMFVAAGCEDVTSYIQSGNVVYRAPAKVAARVPAIVGAAITKRFGFTVPIVLRTADELRDVVANNPFLAAGIEPSQVHMMFLADRPAAAKVAILAADRSPGDAFTVRGRDVYLHLPNGVARTKLTNDWFDRALATTSTVRNWNTVLRLLALATE